MTREISTLGRAGTVNARVVYGAILVGLLTMAAFLPAFSCGFINLDDPYYVTNNQLIKSLDARSLIRIFTESHLGAWLPVTYLSFAVEYRLWGENPFGYHVTNVVLHAVNSALVVILADRFRGEHVPDGASAVDRRYHLGMLLLAGMLFGLHPLRVESVAWVAERKDVLNGLFTISAVLAYVRYVRLKDDAACGLKRRGAYILCLCLFILSLLAKQVSVTLPVILLLLDWFPLRRLRRETVLHLLLEKVPLFLVSLAISLTTVYFAVADRMLIPMESMPLLVRIVVSGNAIFEYCRMSLFPVGISPYFVLPKPLPYGYSVKLMAVVAVTLFLVRFAGRFRGVAVSWFCFVIALAPMLSFIQAGDDIALAARYTYVPAIVPTIGAALLLTRLFRGWLEQGRLVPAAVGAGLVALFLLCLIVTTQKLIPVWRNTGTFWSRVIEVNPVGRAYADRGVYYLINGRSGAALEDFNAAIVIALNSGNSNIYNLYAFRGAALSDGGRFAEAVADFDRAIGLFPHPTYFHLRGTALRAMGRSAEALEDFHKAGSNPPPLDWFAQK